MPSRPRLPLVDATAYRRITLLALWLVVFIVVTGAAVRLTGSGLGCSDWPNCSQNHLVATWQFHAQVEFINRMITALVSLVVAVAVSASHLRRPRRRDLIWLSWGLVAGVAVEIVVGKFVVLSHLNPWIVQSHFLISMALVLDATVLFHRAGRPDGPTRPTVEPADRSLGRVLVAWAAVLVVSGTIVTGAGPHSGANGDQIVKRLPIGVHDAARVHGTIMIGFLGLLVLLLLRLRRAGAGTPVFTAAQALLVVTLLQAAVGYTQYFTGVPPLLVGIHELGASLLWVFVVRLLLTMSVPVERDPAGTRDWEHVAGTTASGPGRDLVPNG